MQEKKDLYVGISNPKELRRNILEASKAVVKCMKIQQKVKEIHAKKVRLKKRLKDDIVELNILISKLNKVMPKSAGDKIIEDVNVKPQITRTVQREKKEIDTLHEQLRSIEERLRSLDKD